VRAGAEGEPGGGGADGIVEVGNGHRGRRRGDAGGSSGSVPSSLRGVQCDHMWRTHIKGTILITSIRNTTESLALWRGETNCAFCNELDAERGDTMRGREHFTVAGCVRAFQPTPSPSATDDVLQAVSCGASQMCTAAGQALDPGGVSATLIEAGN
jgi:hypothetical protein